MLTRKLILAVPICAALSSASAAALACTGVCFNWETTGSHYDNGYSPAVATNAYGAGYELSQHLGADVQGGAASSAELWYNPGDWSAGFASGHFTGFPGSDVTGVLYQSLAGDSYSSSDTFFSAFGGDYLDGDIYIPTLSLLPGEFNGPTSAVSWGSVSTDAYGYQDGSCTVHAGYNPSLAMATAGNGHQYAIVTYQGYSFSPGGCCTSGGINACSNFSITSNTYYQVGAVSGSGSSASISWGSVESMPSTTTGGGAAVALWPMSGGDLGVLEVHMEAGSHSFAFTSGYFAPGSGTVTWGTTTQYSTGGSTFSPKIAYCSGYSKIVEVHNGGGTSYTGWMQTATITNGTPPSVSWDSDSGEYATGVYEQPSVACENTWGVESHTNTSGQILGSSFYWSRN